MSRLSGAMRGVFGRFTIQALRQRLIKMPSISWKHARRYSKQLSRSCPQLAGG